MRNRNGGYGLLILRVSFGAMMLAGHGWPKLMQVLSGDWSFRDPLGIGAEVTLALAIFAEVVCAILVVAGYRTRLAALPLLITMLVAAFAALADAPLFFTPEGGFKELPLLYAFGFAALAISGPGRCSIDNWRRARRNARLEEQGGSGSDDDEDDDE